MRQLTAPWGRKTVSYFYKYILWPQNFDIHSLLLCGSREKNRAGVESHVRSAGSLRTHRERERERWKRNKKKRRDRRAWAIFMLAGVNEQVGQRIAVRVAYTWKGCRWDDGRKERCWSNRNSTATYDTTAAAFLLVELFFVFRSGSGGSVAHWFRFSLLTSTTLRSLLPLVVVLATALECDDPSTSSSSSPRQEDPTVGNWNTTRLRFTKLLNAFCCCWN